MKKELVILLVMFFSISFISACDLSASIVNQDPYPAVPNNYVEVVFQVSGVDNADCKGATFEVVESFPFTVAEGGAIRKLEGSTYLKDYKSDWVIPYKLTVDKNTLDGASEIEVRYAGRATNDSMIIERFEIEIEDALADFEIHVKDYSFITNDLTLEVLNIADVDVEALTLEILKQNSINIRGTNRVVVGDLDSNEYSSADFKGTINEDVIKVKVLYIDQTGVRRSLTKEVNFDSSYFVAEPEQTSTIYYFVLIIIVGVVLFMIFRKRKKRKDRHAGHNQSKGSVKF